MSFVVVLRLLCLSFVFVFVSVYVVVVVVVVNLFDDERNKPEADKVVFQ